MTRDRYIRTRSFAERIVAGLLLVPLSVVMVVVGIAIIVAMGRPILFKQPRLGMNGEVFSILKFRTMVHGAERMGGGYFPAELKLVPPLGNFLRRSSLDELPQLLNVLRGQMSFVGPRPALVSHGSRYTPSQARRLEVPQGLTGLAQVVYRNDAPWSKRIELDVEYVENVSAKLDLWILARTVMRVFRAGGVVEGQTAADVDDLPIRPDRKETS